MDAIQTFGELNSEDRARAGGKGGTLAQLYQAGYPVPEGFVILPEAFKGERLTPSAWDTVQSHFAHLLQDNNTSSLAVRSSAQSEDSALASYGGQFETVLDVRTGPEIRAAIYTVRQSRLNERVKAYSEAKGLTQEHEVAVVVQKLIRAEISGLLFTADPVSGSHMAMSGNYIYGLGDKLVSGTVEPFAFTLERPGGKYTGPPELKRYARKLFKLGRQLEKDLGGPQDIEWAIADGRVYILQSRPITTMQGFDPATGIWNNTLSGDFMWSRNNMGEARPDVMSLLTYSLADKVWSELSFLPGYSYAGNICGRYYANVSVALSMSMALGKSKAAAIQQIKGMLGNVPDDLDIPLVPFTRTELLKAFPRMVSLGLKERRGEKQVPEFLRTNPEWCRATRTRLGKMDRDALIAFWNTEVYARLTDMVWLLGGATRPYEQTQALHDRLTELVGQADASALLSGYSHEGALLASLGPVYGIARVAQGKLSREDYLDRYGHRGPHEAELSYPAPYEDPDWLDQQVADYRKHPIDIDAMIADRRASYAAAWERFKTSNPLRAWMMRRRIEAAGPAAHLRENTRSEITRFYGVIRAWALQAGKLTGLGEDIFHFTIDEILDILVGNDAVVAYLPAREATYRHYRELPTYPMIVRGRFDPDAWANDPQRRHDLYDATAPTPSESTHILEGFAGAAGRVEGVVRVLNTPEEGEQLQPDEILVAVTTNVGWTPLFPRASAIVTDVGAPLSHAAIVARELGIPAVVGCGSATTQLRTGDRIRVDGSAGVVEILS